MLALIIHSFIFANKQTNTNDTIKITTSLSILPTFLTIWIHGYVVVPLDKHFSPFFSKMFVLGIRDERVRANDNDEPVSLTNVHAYIYIYFLTNTFLCTTSESKKRRNIGEYVGTRQIFLTDLS